MKTYIPDRPPMDAEVALTLPSGAVLRGRLKTARTLVGGREVWALAGPPPGGTG